MTPNQAPLGEFDAGLEPQVLHAMVEISGAIGTVLDPNRVAQLAVDRARSLLRVDAAYIWIWSTTDQALKLFAGSDTAQVQQVGEVGGLGQSVVGQVYETRAPVVVDDYQSWEYARPALVSLGTRSAMGVPLMVNDRPVGAMVVHTYDHRSFAGREVEMLALFAGQVAPALETARLYDESERRRAEAEAISLSLAEGLCALDRDGLVTFINPAAEKMLGWTQEELLGKELHPLLHQIDPKRSKSEAACSFGEALSSGSAVRGEETKFFRKDGSVFPASFSASAIAVEGQRRGTVVAFGDITARKRAEQEIRALNVDLERRVAERTAEFEAANKELEAFCYSVSHDLRAPLRSIDGFAQVLLEDYGNVLDEGGQSYLGRVRSASQRMAQLIDDLLELSKLTRTGMQRAAVNLSEMAHSIAEDLRVANPGRNVDITILPGLAVHGDERLLRIVLENLLGNAWKFTAKHEQASIEFGAMELNGRSAFFVRDDGAGFDMSYADKLFGPFQRLHRATEFEGTGIGLATVQRVINRHGGEVWAQGEVERGACFYFTCG